MEILDLLNCGGPGGMCGDAVSFEAIPFSPVRLFVLVGWVYLCLYCVQRIEFSRLVAERYRWIANVLGLLTGPVLWMVLVLVKLTRKSAESESRFIGLLKNRISDIASEIKAGKFSFKSGPKIELLDSSGRNIHEIYGHARKEARYNQAVELTSRIISDSISETASDILIDPRDESVYTVRLRVDGVLRELDQIDSQSCQAVINSIKAVSGMDIAERRRPQDGAFLARMGENTISFRVASAGVRSGEKLSIRVLDSRAGMFKLYNIGLSGKQQSVIEEAITSPSGMILMCGPTGSGKTSTLYAMLNKMDFHIRNVIAVEDPIEYTLNHVSQIEVNPKADITFAKALRSILRQDPDVICVGEIRDQETAGIALQAAQTGHLVLATIHSNSNAAALIRLLDLGVTPLLLSSGLSLVVSQRLVRLLCSNCKVSAKFSPTQLHDLRKKKIDYSNIYQAVGCRKCNWTGYAGRVGIFDLLLLDDKIKAGIANRQKLLEELRTEGDKKGKSNLQKQGMKKVVSGLTSLEELKRVVG
jgi:type II secretory ATPase GspE/PulE/Tfp pilus assembly ATPase PilB-like protein